MNSNFPRLISIPAAFIILLSLFSDIPYAKAAKELVKSAIDVDTSFPDGWE